MDWTLAGRAHGLVNVPVVNLVAGLEDDALEIMPPRLRMSFPPGDLDGRPAPAIGLHHGVTLMLGAGAAEPSPAPCRGVDLLRCHIAGPAVEVTRQELERRSREAADSRA